MLIINILGLVLIAAIVWWFWLYKPQAASAEAVRGVIVVENGVYNPAHISIHSSQETELVFLRKDASPCAGTLLIPALDISEELPVGKEKHIKLPPLAAGSYEFSCQMQMYRGELLVKD
jgi:plastocyanin domain-containing protein